MSSINFSEYICTDYDDDGDDEFSTSASLVVNVIANSVSANSGTWL